MTLDDVRELDATLQARGETISANIVVAALGGSKRDATKFLRQLRAEAPPLAPGPPALAQPPAVVPPAPAPPAQAPAPSPPGAVHAAQAGWATVHQRRAQEEEAEQAARTRDVAKRQVWINQYLAPRPAPVPPEPPTPVPMPAIDPRLPWLPQAQARLAAAKQAERALARAVSYGQATGPDLLRAQNATRAAQNQVDLLEKSLAARLEALPAARTYARVTAGTPDGTQAQAELDQTIQDIVDIAGVTAVPPEQA